MGTYRVRDSPWASPGGRYTEDERDASNHVAPATRGANNFSPTNGHYRLSDTDPLRPGRHRLMAGGFNMRQADFDSSAPGG
jgi:hypothetical protein